MTAPRSRLGSQRRVAAPLRPATGTLLLISLMCALVLPVVRLYTEVATTSAGENVSAAVIGSAIIWVLAALVRWRAGSADSVITMSLKVTGAIAILLGAAVAIARLVRNIYPGPDYDTLSEPHLVLFASWSLLTFVVVAILLSSVRASAQKVRPR